jgi:hypothetical protein
VSRNWLFGICSSETNTYQAFLLQLPGRIQKRICPNLCPHKCVLHDDKAHSRIALPIKWILPKKHMRVCWTWQPPVHQTDTEGKVTRAFKLTRLIRCGCLQRLRFTSRPAFIFIVQRSGTEAIYLLNSSRLRFISDAWISLPLSCVFAIVCWYNIYFVANGR